jgi:hypothetical protein
MLLAKRLELLRDLRPDLADALEAMVDAYTRQR